jgi:ubiquinone/menaquinone biosynthesis C-methylase UbiE
LPTHKEIYEGHAQEYEALVSREDHEGHILRSLEGLAPIDGQDVLDLGTGTGRLAALLAGRSRSMLAFDLSVHMLSYARDKLNRVGPKGLWLAAGADHRHLPLVSACVDLLVSGWSVSYVANWHPESWREELETWMDEARRVLRKDGQIVLFESLGTGNERPQRLHHLEDFYDWLDEAGFANTWIRTDYLFETEEMADKLVGFFFGIEMRANIKRQPRVTLPECTGVWWRQV